MRFTSIWCTVVLIQHAASIPVISSNGGDFYGPMLMTKSLKNGATSNLGALRGGACDTGLLRGGTSDTQEGPFIYPMKTAHNAAVLTTTAIPFAVWFGIQNLNQNVKSLQNDLVLQAAGLNDKAGQLVVQATVLNQLVVQAASLNDKAASLNDKAGQLVWTIQLSFGILCLLLGYFVLFKSI
jgi:hypothetical protein